MMDKWQTIHNFWSGFDIPAYDESSVPDNAVMPYITYSALTSSFENTVLFTADLWYHSTSWRDISLKAEEISVALKGYTLQPIGSNEYLMLAQGSPFAQRMADENDAVKRIHINVMGEFFTHN